MTTNGSAEGYSYEEVRAILAAKARDGYREDVKALIRKYGGEQLSDFKDEPDILTALGMEGGVIGNG